MKLTFEVVVNVPFALLTWLCLAHRGSIFLR